MHQVWGKLLFMHWPIDPALLRPLIPLPLEIDTFDGQAWVAVVPFSMWDIRPFPPYLPAVPGLSAMHELNVRTYVHLNGTPGVWFFSLDCNSAFAVWGARTFYYLPYFNANISLSQDTKTINYNLTRTDQVRTHSKTVRTERGSAGSAHFAATWEINDALPTSTPETLEFFLTERYCLFSEHRGSIYRSIVHHPSWPLKRAKLHSYSGSMLEAGGMPEPKEPPLLHYAESIDVDIWALKKVYSGRSGGGTTATKSSTKRSA